MNTETKWIPKWNMSVSGHKLSVSPSEVFRAKPTRPIPKNVHIQRRMYGKTIRDHAPLEPKSWIVKFSKPACARSNTNVWVSMSPELEMKKTQSCLPTPFPDIHFEPFEEYIVRYTNLAKRPHVRKALAEWRISINPIPNFINKLRQQKLGRHQVPAHKRPVHLTKRSLNLLRQKRRASARKLDRRFILKSSPSRDQKSQVSTSPDSGRSIETSQSYSTALPVIANQLANLENVC